MAITINGTTGVAGVDGSASTPAVQGTDTNTGVTFGADTVNIVTGGTTRTTVDSSGNLQFNSGYGSVATAYGCRAWVNFNGTSTVAIRASGNVTSITDNGTGDYTVNFTNAMSDANYCGTVGFGDDSGSTGNGLWATRVGAARTASAFRLKCGRPDNGALADATDVNAAIFR